MTGKPQIVIPDDFPPAFHGQPELELLRDIGELRIYGDRAGGRDQLLERIRDADFIVNVRAYTPLDHPTLEQLPRLRMIAVLGTGTDNVDLQAADRLGIVVTNAPGANARSVTEHAIALMLAVARQIPAHDRNLRAGEWRHYEGVELDGKTLGVVGLGNIGRAVAMIGSALGMKVIGWSPTHDADRAARAGVSLVEFGELLRESDVISLNVALSDKTRRLIGADELAMMRRSAILINTARGPLIDEQALIAALQQGLIRGAGLDVYETEPLPPESHLLQLENVVLTPHSGWVTGEASRRLLAMPVHNIAEFIAGRPVNVVNPAALNHPRQQR